MKRKNGSPPKRSKRRDVLKLARATAGHAANYIVWAIEGISGGVKWLPTGNDIKVNPSEEALLTRVKHKFSVVCGVATRDDDGKEHFTMQELVTQHECFGKDITEVIKDYVADELKQLDRGHQLSTYYFAVADENHQFSELDVYDWLNNAGVWSKTITLNEYYVNESLDITDYLNGRKLSETQQGGSHYSRLQIQPRDITVAMRLPWDFGNAIKYLVRYKHKNGSEDIKKAFDYIARSAQDGLAQFKQHRVLKAQMAQWQTFLSQFDKQVSDVLGTLMLVYTTKYATEEDFQTDMVALLVDINQLHKREYGTNAY